MNPQPESSFLLPESLNDTSRFSTPRSSIGEGASTDCEADVESNLSVNSEDVSSDRRRSSNGIYGIVQANKAYFMSQRGHNHAKEGKNSGEATGFGWKMMSSSQKLAFMSAIAICLLFILGFLFLYPSCRKACGNEVARQSGQAKSGSNWPIEFRNVTPATKMLLADVNQDGSKEIIVALSRIVTEEKDADADIPKNKSLIIAINAESGTIVKEVRFEFQPFWIHCDENDHLNASCFLASRNGTVAKINMASEEIAWSSSPCGDIHSVSSIHDIDTDGVLDLIVVCSWSSAENNIISGIALISGNAGDLIGSKIRYQLSQLPSSFLMRHFDAKNDTCILFGTQRNGRSTIWAVRLNRLVEIATGARTKVNLVSENPLLVVKNARTDVTPVHYDISADGVKDIGFVLQEGLVAFIDGATLKLRETIDARQGYIMSISILPVKNFRRPLLAVLKRGNRECQKAFISLYDFRNAFDPYVIDIPAIPMLVAEMDPAHKKLFIMWTKSQPKACKNTDKEIKAKVRSRPSKHVPHFLKSKKKASRPISDDSASKEDGTNDIDIDAIDKDVLENLREYVGINDKGVTRHHKLFHLVCNYLLLRFLISYGITTESVLKDFRSTRNHLLNLSDRNLGHVLTNQLKGLLATDYTQDGDPASLLDDLDNDIDWLRDADVTQPISRKRRNAASNGNINKSWKKSLEIPETLKQEFYGISDTSANPLTKDPQKRPVKTSHAIRSNVSWKMNETEVQPGLQNRSSTKWHQGKWKEPAKMCRQATPIFRILEINKANYSWRNITKRTEQTINTRGSKFGRCYDLEEEVKDMLVHKHRLYYISQSSVEESRSNKIIRLSWLKLNY